MRLPRCARVKFEGAIYHIILRSISDVLLFKDNSDKEVFLSYIKKYKVQFNFKLYAYCLMSNHVHLIVDCNGADISKIMHSINQSYAQYYNRKYKRHGHLFQDRFKSKIVNNDNYLMALSLYIHRNPSDISGYKNCIEKYNYSSLGLYFGLRKDKYNILDKSFIIKLFSPSLKSFRKRYKKLLRGILSNNVEDFKFDEKDTYEYRSERKIIIRDKAPELVLEKLARYLGVNKNLIYFKYNREAVKFKALFIFVCRNLANITYKELSKYVINTSQAYLSKLCFIGGDLIMEDPKYNAIIGSICALSV